MTMSLRHMMCCKCGCLKKISNGIVAGLEKFFFKLGGVVGRNPWKTIGLCVLVCGLMGLGFINISEERRYMKNYVPSGSRIHEEHDWITSNIPGVRVESLILEDENILTAETINAIYDMYEASRDLNATNGTTMEDFCLKIGPACQVSSILELWYYDETTVRQLNDVDVYNAVNQDHIINPYYQNPIHPEKFLGGIRRNREGKIIGASATIMVYLLDGNSSLELEAMRWEKELIKLVNKVGHPDLEKVYIYSTRSYDDEAMGTLYNDRRLLLIGFILVYLYLTVSIGQMSLIHHKVLLALAGLVSIGLSMLFTYGFGFATGIMFGQIHQVLPFMLLGIGVDDIFVIMESIHNLTPKEQLLPVDLRIAHTLKSAGVSITVTSITDMVAFAIGGSTVIPALSTFCIYTAVGVFALYILQATFFVACLALDEMRRESKRDACLLWYRHEATYKPNKFYTFSVQHHFMKNVWAPALTKLPVKVIVLLLYLGLTCLNVWNCTRLKFDYDPNQYLPEASYAKEYVAADQKYFPDAGHYTELFCEEADYSKNIDILLKLYEDIRHKQTVQANSVDFWLVSFQMWLHSPRTSPLKANYIFDGLSKDAHRSTAHDRKAQRNPQLESAKSGQNIHRKVAHDTHSTQAADSINIQNKSLKSVINSRPDSSDTSSYDLVHSSNTSAGLNSQPDNAQTLTTTVPTTKLGDPSEGRNFVQELPVDYSSGGLIDSEDVTAPRAFARMLPMQPSDPVYETKTTSDRFVESVCKFLRTPRGMVYDRFVKVNCSARPPTIQGSVLTFRHKRCPSSDCDIAAMEDMRSLVDNVTLVGGGKCFVYSDPQYMYNESNQVLKIGLHRNLALAAISVFVVTLILITNMWTSILVFICVLCTMVDVAGAMYIWDIYLDMASGVILILCFGLAVDHSAHVGHCFMTTTGTGNERLQKTLVSIGPAVFSGGFSTFLAFSILYFTTSYAFILFCRLFTLVVVFGLFHGLLVLPVILSIVGPPPYEIQVFADDVTDSAKPSAEVVVTMLPNGHCENGVMALKDIRVTNNNGCVKQNGFLPHKAKPKSKTSECDESSLCESEFSKYSGSYYAPLTDGSWEEIPCPRRH